MRRQERPPALDYFVFGLALVLSVFVGYHAYLRFTAKTETARTAVETDNGQGLRSGGSNPSVETANTPPERELRGSGTVPAVSMLPGVKSKPEAKTRRKP